MRFFRVLLLAVFTASSVSCLAADRALSPEAARALVQAKTVYLVTGHVQYFSSKGKHFLKPALVDSTPFEEPCRNELEKWGRFKIVSNIKDADLVVRVYMTGSSNSVPVMTPGVTGSVDVGAYFTVLDVIQPSSRKILWSSSKNDARSWSTKTAVRALVKQLREYVEQQEKLSGLTPAREAAVN